MNSGMKKRIEQIESKLGLRKPHITILMQWFGNEDEPPPPEREVGGYTIRYVRYKANYEKHTKSN